MKDTIKKNELRQKAKILRSEQDLATINKAVVQNIKNWPIYQKATHVLSYSAFSDEIDLTALNKEDKEFYLTRTNDDLDLTVHKLNSSLEKHKYGYWQPVAGLEPIAVNTIDLVLVPGLAFGTDGSRLGYGKGYYDRLLVKMNNTFFVGICSTAQIFSDIPQHENDISMHYLITEKEIIETF